MLDTHLNVKHTLHMVYNCLKDIRTERNINQTALAEAIKVSRQTIHSIETGKYVPSIELCLKLAEFLELKVDELFYLKGKKK